MMLETIGTVIVAIITGVTAALITTIQLRKTFLLEDKSEKIAKELLNNIKWPLRSFKILKRRLGGFTDDELRKILVRAGAIRSESTSGKELWGLLAKNKHHINKIRIDEEPEKISRQK